MLIAHSIKGQTVGVLGLGASGLAALDALHAAGAISFAYDDIKTQKDLPAITMAQTQYQPWQDWPWEQINTLVISPGIPHHHPKPHPAAALAIQHNVEIISEVELALRAKPMARLVAITGTNGKSTTTALIGHCLETASVAVAIGGNLGTAVCALDDPGPDGVMVLELSSYQLETTPSLAPFIAVLLNISPDHLDRHGGMDGYVAAKTKILQGLNSKDHRDAGMAVFGSSGIQLETLANTTRARGIKTVIITSADTPTAQQSSSALAGAHNAENASAAALVLAGLGLDDDAINRGIASFKSLPHRLQTVASCGNVRFVNDSKATNGVAAAKALGAFDDIYWVAGGQAKADGLDPVLAHVSSVKKAYLIGASAAEFADSLAGHCPAIICHDLDNATRTAFSDASAADAGGTILLAPAAASFDQFVSFSARGEAFSKLAQNLCGQDLCNQQPGGGHA